MTRPLIVNNSDLSSSLTDGLSRYDLISSTDPRAAKATVLVTTGTVGVDAVQIDRLPALKLIAVHGVGYDKVDVGRAAARGIAVTNTPDVLTDDVADMAIALIFAASRRIVAGHDYVSEGRWGRDIPPPLARRVTGARFGILGMGRIGGAIADRLRPFSPHIAYHNRRPVAESHHIYMPTLLELARWSDVLIVAASGGAATEHLVDAAIIDAIGPDGLLINIGRGSTVDERALVTALVNGRLGGAGLDVFENEPHVPEPLLDLDSVVVQPHLGSATVATRKAMADLVIANVDAFFAGEALRTPVCVEDRAISGRTAAPAAAL